MTVRDFVRWKILSPFYWNVLWKIWRHTGYHIRVYFIRREEAAQERNPKPLFNENAKRVTYVWNDEAQASLRWFQHYSYGKPTGIAVSFTKGQAPGPFVGHSTMFMKQPPRRTA